MAAERVAPQPNFLAIGTCWVEYSDFVSVDSSFGMSDEVAVCVQQVVELVTALSNHVVNSLASVFILGDASGRVCYSMCSKSTSHFFSHFAELVTIVNHSTKVVVVSTFPMVSRNSIRCSPWATPSKMKLMVGKKSS